MTTPSASGFGATLGAQGSQGLPQRPEGWPIGSFDDYESAQHAVDSLSDEEDFPVDDITIVGVNLMQVERVTSRLSWGKVLSGGAISGAWMGVFFGLLVGLFTNEFLGPLALGAAMGALFGLISVAIPYGAMKGRRDFASTTQIVAGRYDVLSKPRSAQRGREILSRKNWSSRK
ncbi:general stress protein [Corynebacterium pseudokroppenstedtii]|uniref:general stress protein n=1 Tax=Corynebacterium pseudokroppenstedtii TaxID=2804917 RepID=UPI00307AB1F9